jgi:hypothetical protein
MISLISVNLFQVNVSKCGSLNKGNDGLVHKQAVAKESSEQVCARNIFFFTMLCIL